MKIVAICGAGVGTSAILKVNAERALERLGISADVSASDVASLATTGADAQVILTSPELVERIPRTGPVLLVANHRSYFDPLVLAIAAARAGRPIRFLGKKEVFDAPVVVPAPGEYVANGAAAQAAWALTGTRPEWTLEVVAEPEQDFRPVIRQQYDRYARIAAL